MSELRISIVGGIAAYIAAFTFWAGSIAGWVYAIFHDYHDDNIPLMILNVIIAPFGALRGIGLFLGWW